MLLVILGLLFLIVSLLNGGGVAIAVLSVPLLLVGVGIFLGPGSTRLFGIGLAVLYAFVIGYMATTPWRGLTPPPGQARAPLDLGLVGLTIAFAVAGVLLAVGSSRRGRVN